jgi:hypothetical protein
MILHSNGYGVARNDWRCWRNRLWCYTRKERLWCKRSNGCRLHSNGPSSDGSIQVEGVVMVERVTVVVLRNVTGCSRVMVIALKKRYGDKE